MSAERRRRLVYLDSSAIVKLIDEVPESSALKTTLRRAQLVSSELARTEVIRAVRRTGRPASVQRAPEVLRKISLLRVGRAVLDAAGALEPVELRSLDAIHLATARRLGRDLARIVTYDERLAKAARSHGIRVFSPS